jgi:acyl carrier protein
MSELTLQSVDAAAVAAIRTLLPEPVEEIPPAAELSDLGMDSMTVMDLVLDLEDTFRVTFPDNALMRIRTVQDVLDLMHEMTGVTCV